MVLTPAGPIIALMIGQVTVWAAIFYSFPALVLSWQEEFGWNSAAIMGAYSLAIAIYALGAPLYGRLIDRGLAPISLPAGGLFAAALLLLVRHVETLTGFYVLWALMGVAMGLTLYEAAFAIVTRARTQRARDAITAIALAAGFASSIAYPLIAALTSAGGWRFAVEMMALLVVVANLPAAAYAAIKLEREVEVESAAEAPAAKPARARLLANRDYWALAAGFALASFATGTLLSHLFPLMAAQGVPETTAVIAASAIGPAQVVGRVAMMTIGRNLPALRISQIGMVFLAVGAVCVGGAAAFTALIFGFALAQGAGYGVVGILRAVATRDVLGQQNFGAIAGAVSLPSLLAFAAAPYIAAVIADAAGYGPVIWLCVIAPLFGAASLFVVGKT